MFNNIFFDLGGVILKHKPGLLGYILSKMFSISEQEGNSLWLENRSKLLKGDLSSEQFLKKLKNKFKSDLGVDELAEKWKNLYIENAEIDQDMLKFIAELKEKYRVYLLTDTIDIHDDYNKHRNIYIKFTKVFASHKEKLAKADGQEFFSHVLRKIDAKAEECIFVDDLEENIKTAESLGIKGILFKNLAQLKTDLYSLAI